MIKIITVTAGLFAAACVSQFPEFTQQYTQRLAGQVEALSVVISDFDASALRAEMTREQALASMGGSTFLDNRRRDMRKTISRHDGLRDDLAYLRDATPMQRLIMPHRVADTQLAKATFDDYIPALPLSVEGLISGAAGYLIGYSVLAAFLHFLAWPFRRARRQKKGLTF